MNNEPVAWINTNGNDTWLCWGESKIEGWTATPLYTHTAKTLTDEEIDELARQMGMHLNDYEIDPLGNSLAFAKAILRKVQEK